MIGLIVLMVVICLAAAVGLSLLIRSREQGLAIASVFTFGGLVGLLGPDGDWAKYLAIVSWAGLIGCVGAIGTFRFWAGGSPKARATATVAGLVFIGAVLAELAYLGLPS